MKKKFFPPGKSFLKKKVGAPPPGLFVTPKEREFVFFLWVSGRA